MGFFKELFKELFVVEYKTEAEARRADEDHLREKIYNRLLRKGFSHKEAAALACKAVPGQGER